MDYNIVNFETLVSPENNDISIDNATDMPAAP